MCLNFFPVLLFEENLHGNRYKGNDYLQMNSIVMSEINLLLKPNNNTNVYITVFLLTTMK